MFFLNASFNFPFQLQMDISLPCHPVFDVLPHCSVFLWNCTAVQANSNPGARLGIPVRSRSSVPFTFFKKKQIRSHFGFSYPLEMHHIFDVLPHCSVFLQFHTPSSFGICTCSFVVCFSAVPSSNFQSQPNFYSFFCVTPCHFKIMTRSSTSWNFP